MAASRQNSFSVTWHLPPFLHCLFFLPRLIFMLALLCPRAVDVLFIRCCSVVAPVHALLLYGSFRHMPAACLYGGPRQDRHTRCLCCDHILNAASSAATVLSLFCLLFSLLLQHACMPACLHAAMPFFLLRYGALPRCICLSVCCYCLTLLLPRHFILSMPAAASPCARSMAPLLHSLHFAAKSSDG